MAAMRVLALFLMLILLWDQALSQPGGGRRGEGARSSNMSKDERQRLRQDVDSARGNYQQRDTRRQDRMAPAEREKLRRDVQDANRDMRKR